MQQRRVRIGMALNGGASWATCYGRLATADISIVGDPTLVLQELARAEQIHTAMRDRIWNDVR